MNFTIFTVLGLTIIGTNMLLIQRDQQLFDAYERNMALRNLQRPPSKLIGYSPEKSFCDYHPDCKNHENN